MKVRQKQTSEYRALYSVNSKDAISYQERKEKKQRRYQWFHIVNNWFKANQDAFATPVSFSWRPKKVKTYANAKQKRYRYKDNQQRKLVLKFPKLRPHLECISRNYNLSIAVDAPNHEFWDFIFDVDVAPKQLADGRWVCYLHELWQQENETEQLQTFSSLQELTEKWILELFLQWVNETLATSSCLCFYGGRGEGGTWARPEKEMRVPSNKYRPTYQVPMFIE